MADVQDHPALTRLSRFERRPAEPPRMGYQPTLDGVRAISVIAVILYHAGFDWMHGGFFGVEVFFVVSGFLITSLLIEERDGSGKVSLWRFWLRRWRRLLPALFTMLVVIGVWAVFWGSAEQHSQVRRDYPWGIFYLANWGQIFSKVAYFSGTPTLFRHLWSLAVEEQWYLIWPVVFIALFSRYRTGAGGGRDRRWGTALAFVSFGLMVATAVAYLAKWPTKWPYFFSLDTAEWGMRPVGTTNFLYLSTFTRSSGLLLGAAMAFLWRPWRAQGKAHANAGRTLSMVAFGATAVLVGAFIVGRVDSQATYVWLLPAVTISSAALVAVVVHPMAASARMLFGWQPVVEIGKRSYGLYLWTWPISRIVGAYRGSTIDFLVAVAIAVPVSEFCYLFIESPIRRGELGRWWKQHQPQQRNLVAGCASISVIAVAASMSVFFAKSDAVFDAAKDRGDQQVAFDPTAVAAATTLPTGSVVVDSTLAPTVTTATLPRRMVIVGDSTAHSLAINLPAGIENTFTITDGSWGGCSVYSDGKAVSDRDNFTRPFGECTGWESDWARDAQEDQAEVALVVIGAWDVFDVMIDGVRIPFGTPTVDQRFTTGLQKGIDALAGVGTKVALLEIPCMRPKDIVGAGVPALPERGDDTRVAHLNEMMRQVAADNPTTTTFVTGPAEYCTDATIADSTGYRWDGVHALTPGTKLTFEAIANTLLSIQIG
ncbi:MAG: acyltransferase [Actinobacteria bacterium]|nr:acyltransferase [Actinomycetota bacterium]